MKKIRWIIILLVLSVFVIPGNRAYAEEEIRIDGYFDDWEGIPKATLTYGSHNAKEIHEAAMVMGEEYLYVYVRLSDLYASQIPVNEYYITVNNKTVVLNIMGKDETGHINENFNLYNLPKGIYTKELGLFSRERTGESLGDVALIITDGNPNDTVEFRIGLSVLEKMFGFEEGTIKSGAEISFHNPNFGEETIKMVGTSTGPLVGAGLCVASVGVAWFVYRKRKQRVS